MLVALRSKQLDLIRIRAFRAPHARAGREDLKGIRAGFVAL